MGSFLGTSAQFIGSNVLLSKLPGVGRSAPLVTGALHGFTQPLREGESGMTRARNAALGAGTMWWLGNGQEMLIRNGLGGKLMAGDFGFNAMTGAMHAQFDSVINTGKTLGLRDTVAAGTMWGICGSAGGKGQREYEKIRTWTMDSAGDRSALGRSFARMSAETQKGVPSFKIEPMTGEPLIRVLESGFPTEAQIYEAAQPAIVRLRTNDGRGGSGFFIDHEGTIATSTHVIQKPNGKTLKIKADLADGQSCRARVLSADVLNDVAIIKIDGLKTPKLELAQSSPEIGSAVYIMGHPDLAAKTFQTRGIRIASQRELPVPNPHNAFETSAPAYGGNSGGPALNGDAKVVGILTNGTADSMGIARRVEVLHELTRGQM